MFTKVARSSVRTSRYQEKKKNNNPSKIVPRAKRRADFLFSTSISFYTARTDTFCAVARQIALLYCVVLYFTSCKTLISSYDLCRRGRSQMVCICLNDSYPPSNFPSFSLLSSPLPSSLPLSRWAPNHPMLPPPLLYFGLNNMYTDVSRQHACHLMYHIVSCYVNSCHALIRQRKCA